MNAKAATELVSFLIGFSIAIYTFLDLRSNTKYLEVSNSDKEGLAIPQFSKIKKTNIGSLQNALAEVKLFEDNNETIIINSDQLITKQKTVCFHKVVFSNFTENGTHCFKDGRSFKFIGGGGGFGTGPSFIGTTYCEFGLYSINTSCLLVSQNRTVTILNCSNGFFSYECNECGIVRPLDNFTYTLRHRLTLSTVDNKNVQRSECVNNKLKVSCVDDFIKTADLEYILTNLTCGNDFYGHRILSVDNLTITSFRIGQENLLIDDQYIVVKERTLISDLGSSLGYIGLFSSLLGLYWIFKGSTDSIK